MDDANGTRIFESTIFPALEKYCYECHANATETSEGGLELDSPAGLRRGGDSGPMLKSHDVDHSRLLQMLRHEDEESAMPPDEKLSDEVIAAFEEWIRLGAPDSREDTGPTAKEQRIEESKKHWAFRGPQLSDPPTVLDPEWASDPLIDNFVLAGIESQGMHPVRDADRRTLVRRLCLDLIGLPPTPEQIYEFVSDENLEAVADLVDRLLALPQFGERWGRHWLDVVRFAESSGMEFNFTYPHAWPYRNYVIDSFNINKPFDVFLREQIAGDLLPGTEGESREDVQSRLIAPSLLAFGPKQHNSGGTSLQLNMADDQIDVVFKSTQALTVSCARCHDHKFDPIPTQDYYALAGIFVSTEPLYGTIKQKYSNTPTDLLPIGRDAQARHDAVVAHDRKIVDAEKTLKERQEELRKATEAVTEVEKQKVEAVELLTAISARQNASSDAQNTVAVNESELIDAKARIDQIAGQLADEATRVSKLTEDVRSREGELAEVKKNSEDSPQYAM